MGPGREDRDALATPFSLSSEIMFMVIHGNPGVFGYIATTPFKPIFWLLLIEACECWLVMRHIHPSK